MNNATLPDAKFSAPPLGAPFRGSSQGTPVYTIAKRFSFSASHKIDGLPAEHPCSRLHGHNYEVEVILQSSILDATGFVCDFRELSALRDFIDTTFDHKHLNEVFGHGRTTAEFIAQWLYDWCEAQWPEVVAVRVSETPKTWAEFRRETGVRS
jgi:6-pyruvoyltetrahydropterin/6-carboxytetrahydropterin synthase